MESYGIHEVLAIKFHQTQWNLMVIHEIFAIKSHPTQWNLVGSMLVLPIKSHQTQWNLMGIHEILAIKFHQTQWNLMVPMRFLQSNLIQPNGILWDPWDFSNQTSSNPMESYGTHEILAIKPHQTQWNLIGPIDFSNQISSNPKESYGPMRTHHCWSLKIWKNIFPKWSISN